ncbi:transporter substrate-binding domain-containing protein [Undibacterium sp. Jales W-56]|uniref:transporter substrate-binding domain-containing protein n=1 Tax=Undibacterium sp. Jales W-56 TaxID=2897325 RepID=UPI0021D1CB4A|nr:transporter substrate-binding domain-containing protein [Undibacterium sp. Jales W-56]MCU6433749.1 transporter substrate-binding domain-containing protein [Undibacterium sp. Jales W-56]
MIAMLFCLTAPVIAEPAKVIRYPRLSAIADPHGDYILELLQLAIQYSGQPFQLVPNSDPMQQARAIYEMVSGLGGIDVMWTMTTDEREAQLIPIRVPIDKGLIGWRIPLLTQTNAELFCDIKSIQELSRFSAGQEFDWPDVRILKANHLPVETSTSYEPLFRMLKAGRFDYFPRSIFEINKELEIHQDLNLHIDKYIVLHYPSALYFFVTPREPKMAKALQNGFEEMIKNGSFEKTFQKHLGSAIKKANIKQRIVIELKNPLLKTDKAPFNRPELWYRPEAK